MSTPILDTKSKISLLPKQAYLAIIYFFYFAAKGTLEPYLNLFYLKLGLDTYHIGIIAAISTFTILVANPIWGAIDDIFHFHKRLVAVLMVGTIVVVTLLLPNVNTFIPLAAVILCYGLFMTPIVPLVDNVAVIFLKGNRYNYGKLRLWGAVGYGLAALSAGALIQNAGMRFAFLGFGLLMAVGVLINLRLPSTSIPKTQTYIRDLRKLFVNRRWIVFLAGMFFAEFALSILMNYFIIYLYGIGGGEGLFGLSILAASISEIPFFFFSPMMLRKFKPLGVLMISCLAISISRACLFFYS